MSDQYFCPNWVAEARAGNQQAIEDLYVCSWKEVNYVIRTMISTDEDTVQDLMQDSFVKAFQRLDQLDDPRKYKAWIKQIARNTTLDYLKKSRAILFSELHDDADIPVDFEDEDLSHLPDVVIDQKDTLRLLYELVDSLSPMQRTMFTMHYIENIPIQDIAKTMGSNVNTVKSHLLKARSNLQKKIRELEKKEDIKLYSLSPLAFLLLLLQNLETQPDMALLGNILGAGTAAGSAAAGAASAGSTAKTAGGIAVKKILAGILAAATLAGGAALYSSISKEPKYPERDLFTNDFRVTFVGTNGEGVANVYSLNGYGLDYDVEPETALSNGDVVTLTLSAPNGEELDEYCEEHYGFTPTSDSWEYTVDTLPEPTEALYDYEALIANYIAVIRGERSVHEIGLDLSRYDYLMTPYGNYIDENGYLVIRYEAAYCYAEYDINDDGINELLFLETQLEAKEYAEATIMEIYTFYDGAPVWLIAGAERCRITLCENGVIYEQGSGGAEAIGNWFYEIKNGKLVEIERAEMDWGAFYVNGTVCNEEEYWRTIGQYKALTDLAINMIATDEN